MIEDLEPESDTLLSPLREENISRRILTVRGHSVILDSEVVTKCDHLVLFDAIRALMNPPKRPRRRIGF
jgi:hypothetical protein